MVLTLSQIFEATSTPADRRDQNIDSRCNMRGLLVFLVAILTVVGAAITTSADVLVLDESNFDEELDLHPIMLVKFYAPWCKHSKALEPDWVKAAEQLANVPVRIAKVDCVENEELAKRYEVKAFPTLKYFRNGKPVEYKGGRSAAEIVAWAYRKIEPKSTTLKTTEDLEKFQAKNELFTLGVFKSLDSEAAMAFKDLADDDEVHLYAITAQEEIKNKLFYPRTIGDKEFVIVFKPFDELRADLALVGKFSTEKVSTFVRYQSTPPVQEFSAATMRRIAASPIKHHVLFFTHKEAAHHATAMQVYYEVSVEFRNQALFVNVPSTEQQVLSYFKIEPTNLPAMVLIDFSDTSKGMKQFPYTGDLSVAEVSAFVSGVLEGNLEPAPTSSADEEKKGEKVSPQDTQGNVVVVKRDSYKEIVMESDKDVLLEFYAPWCGHCKNLAPVWEQLGAKLKASQPSLTIAKIDLTANDVDITGATVEGFPTILYYPRGQKNKPVLYSGARDLQSFESFLESKRTVYSFKSTEL